MQLTDANIQEIMSQVIAAIGKTKLSEDESQEYIETVQEMLTDYQTNLGQEAEITYRIRKRFGRVDFMAVIPGASLDPFKQGKSAERRNNQRKFNAISLAQTATTVTYHYAPPGNNLLSIHSPLAAANNEILMQPMVQAVILGIIAGLVCQLLPPDLKSFVIDDLASPVLSTVMDLLGGIMGPIIFLSLVTSINLLDNLDEFNNLGIRIFKRFALIALFITLVVVAVSAVLFNTLRYYDADLDLGLAIQLLLDVIPTSIVDPFVNNDMPQLVVLGVLMGVSLVLPGDRVKGLATNLEQVKIWANEFMSIVLKLSPLVPFLSVFKLVGEGDISLLVMGWKYVAGAYICAVVCMVIKFVKVSYHTQVGITKLWRSFKPAMVEAFATGSEGAASKKSKSAVATDFGVKHDFSDLWLPLSQAMLAPSTTVLLTLAAFQCAEMSGTPISFGFILILVILSVELSLACPGLTASLTIMFSSLGMSTDYVGFFSAYNVLIRNMQAGFAVTYRMLEHLEEAYVLDAVDGGAPLEGVEN